MQKIDEKQKTLEESKEVNINSYDDFPYESYPYPKSNPTHLRTIAKLFGVEAPKLENARILELGCASGGNLMPFAYMYPNAEAIGVDFSVKQINDGKKLVKKAGLKNLELKHMSITDIDSSFGKFDYIIAHGVYSWVPGEVREKMLEVAGNYLTDNGIAYISYNTLPGWNMVRTIRDMMIYHSSSISGEKQKVNQARLLLEFLKDSTEGSKSAYAQFLRNEAELLSKQPDHYIRHEHLEDNNHQFYFHEFMKDAGKYNMQYLGDSSISSMYMDNLPKKASEKLSEIKDIVRLEQYMDYVTNRRFRSTILCKNNVKINRSLQFNDIEKFHVNLLAYPEKELKDINIEDTLEQIKFYLDKDRNINISTSSKNMKAILYTLTENTDKVLSVDELVKLSAKKLNNAPQKEIRNEFLNNAMKLVLSGHMNISTEPSKHKFKITKTPKISKLARAQIEHHPGYWVSNLRHERVGINAFDKIALRYFDGKNDIETIKQKMLEKIQKEGLTISHNGEKIVDQKEMEQKIDVVMQELINKLVDAALVE